MKARVLAYLSFFFLLTFVLVAGPLEARPGGKAKKATVHVVWFKSSKPPEGGTSDVSLEVRPNQTGKPQVGIVEQYIDGAGEQKVASAWMAAFNASLFTGRPFPGQQFLLESSGLWDGPSAGMLLTSTYVALLDGLPIRPEVTMTGTINPDLTAGPVGGIVQKMQGAKRAGKKLFGYPIGARRHRDLATGKMVDLKKVGRKLGIRAVEVKDLSDGVALLTGKRRREPRALPFSAMDLDTSEMARVEDGVAKLVARLNARVPEVQRALKSVGGEKRPEVQALLRDADSLLTEADTERAAGQLVTAEVTYRRAYTLVETALGMAFLLDAVQRRDMSRLESVVARKLDIVRRGEAAVEQLAGRVAMLRTPQAVTRALDGYRQLASALTYSNTAERMIARDIGELEKLSRGKKADLRRALSALSMPFVYLSAAEVQLDMAIANLETPIPFTGGARLKDEELKRWARSYASAGRAALGYVDSLVVVGAAERQGVSIERVQAALAKNDPGYALARTASNIAFAQARKPSGQLVALAAGADAYVTSGELVNKYYALGLETGRDGKKRITKRRALSHQLELAQRQALQAAGLVKKRIGEVPLTAKRAFLLARARREGGPEDKLEALSSFWWSTIISRMAAALTG